MNLNFNDHYPILAVEHDAILSKRGDITFVYQANLPEIFTLSDEDYENFHQAWVKAIKVLPQHSILHKQDWFLKDHYQSPKADNEHFLSRASAAHFQGRSFLAHDCYILLTKKPAGRKQVNSLSSSLLAKSIVPQDSLNPVFFYDFEDKAAQFIRLLQDSKLIELRRLKTEDLLSFRRKSGLLERYCFLQEKPNESIIRDFNFSGALKIGEKHLQVFTLADIEHLPHLCGPRMTYDRYSTDSTKFPLSFAAPLGLLLNCNHIYNQYLLIEDPAATLKKLETKRLRLQSLSAASRSNLLARDATNEFLNEAISQQRLPLKAHFNVLVWHEDISNLKEISNQVSSAFAKLDASCKQESIGAAQIWWAGIPGNAAELPSNECFDTFAQQGACFLNLESNYRSAEENEGIRFTDRLQAKPIYVDLFDEPRRKGITSNMGMLVCGTSGGGKSMTVNHILRSLYEAGAHCVTVDIGGSYAGLCELLKGYYFSYTEAHPIRFNPFYLSGARLDTEKKESLKALLTALWKQEQDDFKRSEYVALSNALQGYYDHLQRHSSIFPGFNSFYDYLSTEYKAVLAQQKVRDRDFDLDNFLYVLAPYYQGGEFDYLLNATENLDLLHQAFIVIELDNIKDHPILFPVVTLIIMEMFISKMRKLPGIRKVLTIDEAWKAIAKSGMAEFLKYAFKTIRKFNGIPIVITQELDDLVSSPIIKDAIINNADIKILMDMRKFQGKFDKLQDTLGLSEKGKTILLSVNKDERELFIDIGGQELKVYRNELSPEEYYAYTTEGRERVALQELSAQFGSIEKAITIMVKNKEKHH